MDVKEVVIKGTETALFYRCGGCGQVFATHEVAEQCCVPYRCDTCGCETPRYWTRCESCREMAKLLKAVVTPVVEFSMVQSDAYPHNEGYLDIADLDDLNELGDPPAFAWGTTFTPYRLDADTIMENALDDHHEDAEFDHEQDLRDFVEDFNAKQKGGTYHCDESRVVVLDPVRFEALLEKARQQEALRAAKKAEVGHG